jgi:ubiquinone/menaquinone biosynthesis C-methylase UbiE
MLRKFFALNHRLCKAIEPHLPQTRPGPSRVYRELVARYMNARGNQLIVDVGGGKRCPFARYRDEELGNTIVAVDASEDEMKGNQDVDEKRVANVAEGLPFKRNEVDIVASRYVLEHLEDVERFVSLSHEVLKEHGYSIHLLPSKFAPFALLNQLLSARLAQRIQFFIYPETRGGRGFVAYYDKCYYSALRDVLAKHGFRIVDARFNYYQSHYFTFFAPLYILSCAYELLLRAIGAKNLSPYLIFVAQKATRGALVHAIPARA